MTKIDFKSFLFDKIKSLPANAKEIISDSFSFSEEDVIVVEGELATNFQDAYISIPIRLRDFTSSQITESSYSFTNSINFTFINSSNPKLNISFNLYYKPE